METSETTINLRAGTKYCDETALLWCITCIILSTEGNYIEMAAIGVPEFMTKRVSESAVPTTVGGWLERIDDNDIRYYLECEASLRGITNTMCDSLYEACLMIRRASPDLAHKSILVATEAVMKEHKNKNYIIPFWYE